MAAYPLDTSPWPTQTPPPSPPSSSKRKRHGSSGVERRAVSQLRPRQLADSAEITQAKYNCEVFSGNNVTSCFPDSNTVVPQHEWTAFVWNSNLPNFAQTNRVNIYLIENDSQAVVNSWLDQQNPTNQAGSVQYQVNDSWWPGALGSQWNGQNISFSYYWVIIPGADTLDASAVPQSTFQAVQTTYADSVLAAMSSTASAASASSASAARESSLRGSPSGSAPSSSNGSVQSQNNDSTFPHWAIAVIVVLGFLAIVASCILIFFIMRRMRRRNQTTLSHRGSMGSASPMMANVQSERPQSPLLGASGLAPAAAVAAVGSTEDRGRPSSAAGNRPPSVVSPDGASTVSRTHSVGDAGPFSGADAAIMADAFRKALRKPDFAEQPVEEGESPDGQAKEELLNRELAEEGRDIRSVSSSRGVKVETLSDSGDTVQDHPH